MILNIDDDIIIKNIGDLKKNIVLTDKDKKITLTKKELFNMVISFNKKKTIDYLLENELLPIDNIDYDGRTILYDIIKFNYFDTLKKIIEYNTKNIGISIQSLKDKKNNTSLFYTIIFNRYDMFVYMINKNFDPYHKNFLGLNCFHLVLKLNRTKMINFLIEKYEDFSFVNSNNESYLYLVLQQNDNTLFEKIINKKIDINLSEKEYYINPLIITVVNNMINEFNILIKQPSINPTQSDKYGNTILHYAILENRYKIIIKIIELFETFNYQNLNGSTPFHLIVQNNELFYKLYQDNPKLFEKMVDKTNFNLINNEGESVAFSLLKNSLDDIALDIIKKKKINPLIVNLEGNDIIDIVKTNPEVINIFVKKYYNALSKVEKDNLEKWEKHCLDKNYKTLENDYNIKKHTKNLKNEEKCYEIIRRKILLKEKALPTKKEDNIKINNGIPMIDCYYTGSSIDTIYGLIFLKNNLNSIDILIEYPLTENKELEEYYSKMNKDYPYKLDFSNFEIIWFSINIFYPSYLDKKIEEYKDRSKRDKNRFIVIPIGIELNNGNAHANVLLIDNINKIISRFEPHGALGPDGIFFNEKLLDKNLKNKFKNIFEDYTYKHPKDYLPNIGFQALENLMTEKCKKIGDPNGFCAIWCVWWVYQRVNYSNFDIKTLAEKLINKLKIDKVKIPDMIRNFSNNISKLRDEVLKNNNIDINDWINSNYDSDILDNIEKDTFSMIIS